MFSRFAAARIFALGAVLTMSVPSHAVDSNDRPVPELAAVRAQIDQGGYDQAIVLLRQVIAARPNDADALNLMGFSLRKSGDFDRALGFYQKALRIEPGHLGANEYLGELYVETGEAEGAQRQLIALEGLCGTSCEEYLDLKTAIAAAN